MLINSSPSSLRPVTLPADFASTSLTYASAPLGTITRLSTTIGASSEALNTWPDWFVFESMLSIVRTVTIVFAGTVTVTGCGGEGGAGGDGGDRKSTRLNSSHGYISYAVFCLKKQK